MRTSTCRRLALRHSEYVVIYFRIPSSALLPLSSRRYVSNSGECRPSSKRIAAPSSGGSLTLWHCDILLFLYPPLIFLVVLPVSFFTVSLFASSRIEHRISLLFFLYVCDPPICACCTPYAQPRCVFGGVTVSVCFQNYAFHLMYKK